MKRIAFFLLLISPFFSFGQTPFDQHAQWISPVLPTADSVCPVFTGHIPVSGTIRTATLWITAQGLYEGRLNGHPITTAKLTPGFTSYQKRLLYQQYDVTRWLHDGHNSLQVTTAGGWYRGVFGGDMLANRYGHTTALLAALQIEYKDGRIAWIGTDTSWRVGSGPIRLSGIYDGACIDHRVATIANGQVKIGPIPIGELAPSTAEPVEAQEIFASKKIIDGTIIDFGQNLAGYVRLRVKGKPGDTITIEHAEMLDSAGGFFNGNLREARATDRYIPGSNGWEIFEPSFTYHGFRYARIRGVDGRHVKATAVAIHNNLRRTGAFECSNPLLNQLQHNIEWSLNSNFVSIPTDCPQRSERFGWTGDAQVFVATAAYNRDVHQFFASWLRDLAAEQGRNGGIPSIVPDIYRIKDTVKNGVAGWGDAATIIPWTLFQLYNDTALLCRQYPSMKLWVEFIRSKSPDGLWKGNGYGDWYAQGDSTSLPFIDQCFYAYSTGLVAKAAGVLGNSVDSLRYARLLDTVITRFRQTYSGFDRKGMQTQTAYILALAFDLLPVSERSSAAAHLAAAIHDNDDHLATGFLGTPYLLPVLSRFGYDSLAFRVLLQTTCPSWLYPITRGATTIWEKWDAVKPNGSVQVTSFNHYSYGAVGNWLYQYVAGIAPDASSPGYGKVIIQPHPGGGLSWCKASYETPRGLVTVRWTYKKGRFVLDTTIPPDVTATVLLPAAGSVPVTVGAGKHRFRQRAE